MPTQAQVLSSIFLYHIPRYVEEEFPGEKKPYSNTPPEDTRVSELVRICPAEIVLVAAARTTENQMQWHENINKHRTVSFGVSIFMLHGESIELLAVQADNVSGIAKETKRTFFSADNSMERDD